MTALGCVLFVHFRLDFCDCVHVWFLYVCHGECVCVSVSVCVCEHVYINTQQCSESEAAWMGGIGHVIMMVGE